MKNTAILLGAGALLLLGAPLRAQGCPALVGEYTNWLTRTSVGGVAEAIPAGSRKAVGFTIAANQRNDQSGMPPFRSNLDATLRSLNVVAYGIGTMRALTAAGGTRLDGVGQFFFSDRSRDPGSTVYTGFTGETDPIGLSVAPDGMVRITLRRWGNAVVTVPMQCQNGVMFGFGGGIGGNSLPAMYVVSFAKQFIPI